MSATASSGSIVTFYSWKGGVGRTMALANVAVQLARKGRKILLVDWDLEAPGLDRYFLIGEGSDQLGKTLPKNASGLMGLLDEAKLSASGTPNLECWQERLYHFTVPKSEGTASHPSIPTPGALHLLASGLGTVGYSQKVADFSWNDFFAESKGGEWLEALRGQWREQYDFVLIDSRTGLTDSGGVCTVQMPDVLVLVFTSNEQSLQDGLKFAQSVQTCRRDFAYDRAPLAVLPLLSRWSGDDEVDLGVLWLKRMDADLRPITSSWLPKDFTPRDFLEKVRIPHVARFSFGEPLPVITHSISDNNLPGLAYESVAVLLETNLAAAGRIIDPSYEPLHYSAGYQNEEDLIQLSLVQDDISLHREISRLSRLHGAQSLELLDFLNNAGMKLYTIGRFTDAEPLMRRAVAISEARFGSHHPAVTFPLSNLALLLNDTNRLSEAEPLIYRCLAIDESSLDANHPNIGRDLNNLAQVLKASNRLAEAEPLMRRALAIDEANHGTEHPLVAIRLGNLAMLLKETNRQEEAEPLMRRALAIDEASLGTEHPQVAIQLNNLAMLLSNTNRLGEAEMLIRRALAINEASYGTDHPHVAILLNNLATVLMNTNRLKEAEPLMRRAFSINEASFGTDHPAVAKALHNLASLLHDSNRLTEAEPLMLRALEIIHKSVGSDHPSFHSYELNYRRLLEARGAADVEFEVERLARERVRSIR